MYIIFCVYCLYMYMFIVLYLIVYMCLRLIFTNHFCNKKRKFVYVYKNKKIYKKYK